MHKVENIKVANGFVLFWGSIFSQWWKSDFTDKTLGLTFSSAEQYMMYHKAILFDDKVIADKIMNTQDPRKQKALGRQVSGFDAEKWNAVCEDVVIRGNYLKFSQNQHLKECLIQFKELEFVEASPMDKIWGIGLSADDSRALNKNTWKGKNLLGISINSALKMILRDDEESDWK